MSLAALYCISDCKGVQVPSAPRFKPPSGLRPWASKVPPTERAGSEGVIKYGGRQQTYCIPESKRVQAPSAPGFKPPPGLSALSVSGSAHRAGWFKGSYKVRCVRIPHGIRKSGEVGL